MHEYSYGSQGTQEGKARIALNCVTRDAAVLDLIRFAPNGRVIQKFSHQLHQAQTVNLSPAEYENRLYEAVCSSRTQDTYAKAFEAPPKVKTAPKAVTTASIAPTVAQKAAPPSPPKLASTGSGFFVSPAGHLVTNAHVVARCAKVTVKLGDLVTDAQIVAKDGNNDLAVLQVKTDTKFVAASLRKASDEKLGEHISVLGYPLATVLGGVPRNDIANPHKHRYSSIMRRTETETEMVQRHIKTGDILLARQRVAVIWFSDRGLPTELATSLLRVLEVSQSLQRAHLKRLL